MDCKILITGDFCPIGRNVKNIENNDSSIFDAFIPFLDNVNFAVTNLEAPITYKSGKIKKSGPNIKGNPNTAKILSFMQIQTAFNLIIFNSGQHDYIKKELEKYGITNYRIEKVSFENMPARMREIDISLFFIHPVFSKRASAATKLGELLATGIPVITNAGMGDHEYYIDKYLTGKVINTNEINNYDFNKIISELNNVECKRRCREVAEKYFSLENGIAAYKKIYTWILNK
jgi:glycosyltransferase involved in cell wall biosynthesis